MCGDLILRPTRFRGASFSTRTKVASLLFFCLSQGMENSFLQGKGINKISDILDLIFSFLYARLELEEGLRAHLHSQPICLSSVHY